MSKKWVEIYAENKEEALERAILKLKELYDFDVQPADISIKKGKVKIAHRFKKEQPFIAFLKEEEEIQGKINDSLHLKIDGAFRLKVTPEGVLLKIIKPQNGGSVVKLNDIRATALKKELIDVNWKLVEEMINANNEGWFKIAERRPDLDRDAIVEVEIVDNKMRAVVDYKPPLGGRKLTPQELLIKLNQKGVVSGIQKNKIPLICNANTELKNYLIAQGQEPLPGQNGSIKWLVDIMKEKKKGKLRGDDTVDFRELDLIENVRKGDELLELIPPQTGKAGFLVTGEELAPPKAKPRTLPKGKKVQPNEKGDKLLAAADGHVSVQGGRVSVLPIYQVNGDIDLKVGNIDFLGSVVVTGNVLEGFVIKAEGDVEIYGSVSGADIICGGNILIRKGFSGQKRSKIEAGGDVIVKFVENASITAKGDIDVTTAIMHSDIKTCGHIKVGGKGLIVGGSVIAGEDIEARVVGSAFATKTSIAVGLDPELIKERAELINKINQSADTLDKTNKAVTLLEKQLEQKRLSAERQELLYKLQETQKHLNEELEHLRENEATVSARINAMSNGRLKVSEKIYPGVTVQIADLYRVIDEVTTRTAVVYDRKAREIVLSSL